MGEFGGVKIWCDDCGSNNPESPPSVKINGKEQMTKQIKCDICGSTTVDHNELNCSMNRISQQIKSMTKQTSTTQDDVLIVEISGKTGIQVTAGTTLAEAMQSNPELAKQVNEVQKLARADERRKVLALLETVAPIRVCDEKYPPTWWLSSFGRSINNEFYYKLSKLRTKIKQMGE